MHDRFDPRDFSWPFWPVFPLYPYGQRRTLRKEIVRDTLWAFDQMQGIFYVVVPIRMSVVKLSGGGLLVYAPVAPTRECIRLMEELVAEHGEVKYIILPTASGLEHKVFVGPFARCFQTAQVYVAPSQWSFPLNLPISWLGFPGKRTHILPEDSSQTPFGDEFDYAILDTIELGPGRFQEVAFFHKRSRTLLVTDSVVSVPKDPPAIVQLNPFPLLFHAKDSAADSVEDTQDNRHRGWQRICLFALYFQPGVLEVPKWGRVFRDAFKAVDRSKKAYFGLFPFQWKPDWRRSFEMLRGGGRLLVAPVLQTLILNRAPKTTLDWADRVASWNFDRIVPCHFSAPVTATPTQFRQAFSFLEKQPHLSSGRDGCESHILPPEDLKTLESIDAGLNKSGIVPPPKEKV
ncbi:MAG: DUF4336 domain-containing protein [Cyanobacteriota bacterium]|nr:DUF4336 domain-containing protein [Cyanobacteriota bacterium]